MISSAHLLGWSLSLIFSLVALGLSLVPAIPVSAYCNGRFARLNLSYRIYCTYVTEGSLCSNSFLVCASNCPFLVAPFPRDSSMHTVFTLKQYLSVQWQHFVSWKWFTLTEADQESVCIWVGPGVPLHLTLSPSPVPFFPLCKSTLTFFCCWESKVSLGAPVRADPKFFSPFSYFSYSSLMLLCPMPHC